MAWVRIHEGAYNHQKINQLSDKAFRLWVWGLTFVQQNLTDGMIITDAIPGRVRRAAPALIAAGLWHPAGQNFRVHDYLEWNDDRETVLAKRAATKDRVTRHRKRVTPSALQRECNALPSVTLRYVEKGEKDRVTESGQPSPPERVLDAYRDGWKHAYGHDSSLILSPLEYAALVQQTDQVPIDRLLAALAAYFATADPYVRRARHPLPLFLKDPLKYLAGEAQEAPQRPRGCRHEPACEDDAAHTRRDMAERRAVR